MSIQRRLLPSMSALCAFDAAARTGSFTAAARELDLTQGAISRQIRALEQLVGQALFVREKQRIMLTEAGETYAREIRSALQVIGYATLRSMSDSHEGVINLAILPTFGSRWLIPRLPAFFERHPKITINFATRIDPFDFARDGQDAAIHFGGPDWPGAESSFLMDEEVVPVCSPALVAKHHFRAPADLLQVPLLHIVSRPRAWEDWFHGHDVALDKGQGMHFEQFNAVTQAACSGLGVALLPRFLINSELERGELQPAVDRPAKSRDAYYFVAPNEKASDPAITALRDWLIAETREFTRERLAAAQ